MDADDRRLAFKETAAYLGVSEDTLRRLIKADESFPRFVAITPRKRYVRLAAVRAWVERKERIARQSEL